MTQVPKRQRRASFKSEFYDTYVKLTDFIDQVNEKIVGRIQLVQQIYIEDYKTQVKEMTGQLRGIRIMLDEELLRQRSNQRMFYLQEERDFFRGQVMKLNEELTRMGQRQEALKAELEEKTAESENYRSLVYNLQRKLTRIQNEAIEAEKVRDTLPYASTPSLPPVNKQLQSQSPTRATITRLSQPIVQPTASKETAFRSFKSVESTRKQPNRDSELLRREQILDRCIQDIKKKIFYRTLGEKPADRFYFDEEKQVQFDKFKRGDKQQLVAKVLNSGQLLEEFYGFMVGKRESPRPQRQSIGKSGFSDKIFKIKLYGLKS